MKIFNSYTGNAMLNNALMTIEILGSVASPNDVTIELLKDLFQTHKLSAINKRFKNYTMLFTKNGPLHNDKAKGEIIYNTLMKAILENYENDGELFCEISGLRFKTPFTALYNNVLKSLNYTDIEINKKDLTIGRTWFPLVGGLGSDAQALPQAKFTINIHPICIFLMQFLPFSSVLYKGGIMLIDSSNFDFSKELIRNNISLMKDAIAKTSISAQIENVKGISKGNFVANAINILDDKEEDFEDDYTDLNFWSFSNSGTGASCEVDRLPNELLKKLIYLYQNPLTMNELKTILNNNVLSEKFLESLNNNEDWYGLYPNLYKKGKKTVKYEGVSPDFLISYFTVTKQNINFSLIKYIASIILEYKTDRFENLIEKSDGHKDSNFTHELYSVLINAVKKNKFNPLHYIKLINKEHLPISPFINKYDKLIHFFCYKKEVASESEELDEILKNSEIYKALKWMVSLINLDTRKSNIIKSLLNAQTYESVRYLDLFIRNKLENNAIKVTLEEIMYVFYNETAYLNHKGLNKLLRLYFSQEKNVLEDKFILESNFVLPVFVNNIGLFANDYKTYYLEKYKHKETGELPISKYKKQIASLELNKINKFLYWFREAITNLNEYNKLNNIDSQWDEDILYDADGNFATTWIRFIIKFQLLNI